MSRSAKRRRRDHFETLRAQSGTGAWVGRQMGRSSPSPLGTSGPLAEASQLVNDERWDEARDLLEEFWNENPNSLEALHLLQVVYHKLQIYSSYCHVSRKLVEFEPDSPPLNLALATGYHLAGMSALAIREFRKYVRRWPNDAMAERVRQMIARLEPILQGYAEGFPGSKDELLELYSMLEEAQQCLVWGDDAEACALCEQIRARSRKFLPAQNTLSRAYFSLGRFEESLEVSRGVLADHPDNFHAVANLVASLFLLGRFDESQMYAERLKAIDSPRADLRPKQMEALAYLGDDEGTLRVFASAEQSELENICPDHRSLMYHLAAVASARQGQEDQARRYWNKALKFNPGLVMARENLADIQKPPEERHGPYPYSFEQWIRVQTLRAISDARPRSGSTDEERSAIRRVLPELAGVLPLIPVLLDRGDPLAREFAIQMAQSVGTPETVEALRVFCQSQRGTDKQRMQVAQALRRQGVLSAEPLRMWSQGNWETLLVLGFEISDEMTGAPFVSDQVDDLYCEAYESLQEGEGAAAERLLKLAIQLQPDHPMLHNNLAKAYELQGQLESSHRLIRDIHRRWPDYLFGRTAMSTLLLNEEKFDEAEALLNPLLGRPRFHTTEFRAVCVAMMQLFMAQGKLKSAAHWLEIWKQALPDDPQSEVLEEMLNSHRAHKRVRRELKNAKNVLEMLTAMRRILIPGSSGRDG
ncbi:MAG: tetratricopeptide repeat protein [Planctomycetales bacterium]